MRQIFWILFVCVILFSGCCNWGEVMYDDTKDSFLYKPESNFDYAEELAPSDIPLNE